MKIKDIFLIPNIVTLSRLFITILLFQQYTPKEFSPIILIIIIAIIGLSDSLDGIIAWKLNQVSKLGTILDPITDRIVFILLIIWLSDNFEYIFVLLIFIREGLVSIGGLYVLISKKTLKVSNKGKVGTALIFISLCMSVITNESLIIFIDIFIIFSVIFYYYVALEYLYNLIKKNEQRNTTDWRIFIFKSKY